MGRSWKGISGERDNMWFFLALRNLFRNFRRTIAVLFTVALGTGALFSFDGFINGVLKDLRYSTIHSNYGFGQIHTKGYRDTVFENPTEHWIFDSDRLLVFLSQLEGVQKVFPRVSFSALLKNGNVSVGGGKGIRLKTRRNFLIVSI